jgi:hypothetical protein
VTALVQSDSLDWNDAVLSVPAVADYLRQRRKVYWTAALNQAKADYGKVESNPQSQRVPIADPDGWNTVSGSLKAARDAEQLASSATDPDAADHNRVAASRSYRQATAALSSVLQTLPPPGAPPKVAANSMSRLTRVGQSLTGTGADFAAAGSSLVGQRIMFSGTIVYMSPMGDASGVTQLVSFDGRAHATVRWNDSPQAARNYFLFARMRLGALVVSGTVHAVDNGQIVIQADSVAP